MPRFLVVPDKFKGSLTAEEAAAAIARGLRDAIPSARVTTLPLADGGDGTGRILARHLGARMRRTLVTGPRGEQVFASWGIKEATAWLDMAAASGLALLPPSQHNPLLASSRGLGELILAAVHDGAREIVLGVGGSATMDGGIGAMRALGIQFLDERRREVGEGGGALNRLHAADPAVCALRDTKIRITLLADVLNPLLGPRGAAPVFAPQKGATPSMIPRLQDGFHRLDRVIAHWQGRSFALMTGGGAAGGVAAGFAGILGAVPGVEVRLVSGIDHVCQVLNVEAAMRRADWVMTGEGRLDSQTAQGKTISGVTRLASKLQKPVVAFAGQVVLNPRQTALLGLTAAFGIAPFPCPPEECVRRAGKWLRASAFHVGRLIAAADLQKRR